MDRIKIASAEREQMIDITAETRRLVEASRLSDGICVLFTQHTTCGLTVNENADPDVQTDMLGFLQKLVPQYFEGFRHFEHNSDAHIKTSLVGTSVTIPFAAGKLLLLGRWQAIYLCEFDGPREREVVAAIR
ncbi:MAG: secondary thiamine-phosphate synthase enzyme YjbQ [Acidobacteriota bacterium]